MIKSIKKIKNFGIFQNYQLDSKTPQFLQFNLFYGLNGSGKSTLSKLFRNLELKSNHKDFTEGQFEIELLNGNKISDSYSGEIPEIRVFNQDFVKDNINLFDATTKPIIFISAEKIQEKLDLEKHKGALKSKTVEIGQKKKDLELLKKETDKCHTDSGKAIKDFFLETIHAKVTYNKTTSEAIWNKIKTEGNSASDYILSETELGIQKSFTYSNSRKEPVLNPLLPLPFDLEILTSLYDVVKKTYRKNVASTIIDRLKANPDLNDWVQRGLQIHNNHSSLKCEYCQQPLPKERKVELETHFNDEYTAFQNEIQELIDKIKRGIRPEIQNIQYLLYDDLKAHYKEFLGNINQKLIEANDVLNEWIRLLDLKKANPFQTEGMLSYDLQPFSFVNSYIIDISGIVERHNAKTLGFNEIANTAKNKIENHFVAQKNDSEKVLTKESNAIIFQNKIDVLNEEIGTHESEIIRLEGEIKNDNLAIEEINENLHKFLGRNDLNLQRNPTGGYQLIREGSKIAQNLSEGEKTAISLIYFLSKLKENDTKVSNTIVVLDDPISSFDSNNLFNSAHFIKEEFITNEVETVKQLFILTHNFNFFSLINEWIPNSQNKTVLKSIYCIKSYINEGKRVSKIEEAEYVIKQFSSEYHYIFSEIKKYNESSDKSYLNTHSIANLCRQLLESFLSFKFGRKKLDKCFDSIQGFDDLAIVRKFVNHYSHRANHGSSIRGFNDNVFAETDKLVPLVLNLIEHVDSVHFKSMNELIDGI